MSSPAHSRLAALRTKLASENVDAIALTSVPNIAYCTGFDGVFDAEPAHFAIVTSERATVVTDSRYFEALRQVAEGTAWDVQLVAGELTNSALQALGDLEVLRVALETSMPHARYAAFAERFTGEVVAAADWIETMRQTKEPEEVGRIAVAQELTDRAFEYILGLVRAGVSELQVALDLEYYMRREGSDGVAFEPIVATGPNSALPHARATERVLSDGDFVVLDFGARVDGYCADMTRTVMIGSATDRHRELYAAVQDANAAGIAALRPGRPGKEIDAAARRVISDRGFGEYFGHGLGHGVGREVHELPSVGPRSEALVPAGSVVTIEPGVYIPGFGGARIEDLVVVEDSGARVLTRSPKDLMEL